MKEAPKGWPRISSSLFYDDAATAIDWLCRAFGFEVRLKVVGEGGHIEHSELTYGDGLIMVGSTDGRKGDVRRKSPRAVSGGNTQSLFMYVDDVEAHLEQARAAGAKIVSEPQTNDYGDDYWVDRTYEAEDLEGHRWWFGQRLRTGGK
jgi:uncharacterized glyoxalase superfamily protein PhnB